MEVAQRKLTLTPASPMVLYICYMYHYLDLPSHLGIDFRIG
jgi:hypothetical protein